MENPNPFDMQTDDEGSSLNQPWDNDYLIALPDDEMIIPSYDLNPFSQDQMITSMNLQLSYDGLIPFSQDQMINSMNLQPSYDHLIPYTEDQMITSVNPQPLYDDSAPSSNQNNTTTNQLPYDSDTSSDANPSFNINSDSLLDESNFLDDEEFFSMIPLGYIFDPSDEQLVVGYLKKLVNKEPLPPNQIHKVNVYEHSPEDLARMPGVNENNEWYFFSPYKRKSRGGTRMERMTPNGFWKASSGDKPVKYNGEHVGNKKILVYYAGKPGSATKTNWIMYEYRLVDSQPAEDNDKEDMMVCKIHKHTRGGRS